ncbi:MAG: ImcF-related family protein [Betaproteobacteria bacterium]|nr:ImcF-related family protein [Betaproteobacteria bacterium]
MNKGGGNAALVFTRASGQPLTRGVPGLFSYDGYHKGFQSVVGDVTRQLAEEQTWVLGIEATDSVGASAMLASGRLVDDVRRIYLNEYRDTWKTFIADVRLQPVTSIAQSIEKTRFLAAPDNPLVPLLRAMSRETTLLAGQGAVEAVTQQARGAAEAVQSRVLGALGARRPTTGAPASRIESIVDDDSQACGAWSPRPKAGGHRSKAWSPGWANCRCC